MSSEIPLNDQHPVPYLITSHRMETADVFTISLRPERGGAPLRFLAGQFNMVYAFGAGDVPISISGNPHENEELLHTIRALGSVTNVLSRLREGSRVGIRGPFGSSWPLDQANGKDVLLIAGGLGLAPLRPALSEILSKRRDFGEVTLLYGARTPADLIFTRELHDWRSRFDLEVEVTVDSSQGDWNGNVGVVPALIEKARFDPKHCLALICGPEVMMRFTIRELMKQGLESARIFLSLERNMKCALGFCGRCQYREHFLCKDGPVFSFERVQDIFGKREL